MASNKHTGLNPLGIPRIDFTKEGINSGFALLSREVAKRTPLESQTEGSIHLPGGVFNVPPTPIEAPRMRPAFNVVMFVKDGETKAHFQEAFVIDGDNIVDIFATPEDQILTVAIDEVYYVQINRENGEVTSAELVEEQNIPDLPTGEFVKVVEFEAGEIAGTFKPVYFRYDSIVFSEDQEILEYTFYLEGGSTKTITEFGILDGYDPNRVADPEADPPIPGPDEDWSQEFEISETGDFSGEVGGTNQPFRFDEDPQTFYRLPIIIQGRRVSSGGLYQEVKMCVDGESVVQFIKVG